MRQCPARGPADQLVPYTSTHPDDEVAGVDEATALCLLLLLLLPMVLRAIRVLHYRAVVRHKAALDVAPVASALVVVLEAVRVALPAERDSLPRRRDWHRHPASELVMVGPGRLGESGGGLRLVVLALTEHARRGTADTLAAPRGSGVAVELLEGLAVLERGAVALGTERRRLWARRKGVVDRG